MLRRLSEALVRRCSVEKVFLEISKNSHENACAARVSFFNKVAGLWPATLLKKRLWKRCSCELREISKNAFFYRTPPLAASGLQTLIWTSSAKYISIACKS